MQNNAHNEPKDSRLSRFENNPPAEIIDTLLNSIDNHLNNEIRATLNEKPYQTTLLFLGIHASILTISYGLYGKDDGRAYKTFLEQFVDGATPDTKFSDIAELIHDWRNVLAHQWIGSIGHSIGYDYEMALGWEVRDEVTFINPKIYAEHYLNALKSSSSLWRFDAILTTDELEAAKVRLLKKYVSR